MARHVCRGEDCGICQRDIEAREYGDDLDFTPDEMDQRADGAGADMAYGREW